MSKFFETLDIEKMSPQEIKAETKKVMIDILKLIMIISLICLILVPFSKWFFKL